MIDNTNGKPLNVRSIETPWPYIQVAASQRNEVHQLLTEHGIRHWLSEDIWSFNDGPMVGRIEFGRGVDAKAVQAILDSVG